MPIVTAPSTLDALYGLMLSAGGLAGFLRAKSLPSLIAGVGSGLVVSFAASKWVKSLASLLLGGIMGVRWRLGGKFMPAGPENPLGSHALYLSWPNYRIHGTSDTRKIGRQSSSGCIGLYNEHIEELFALVEIGTTVRLI